MAKTWLLTSHVGQTLNAGATAYPTCGQGWLNSNGAESNSQLVIRESGTASKMSIHITANTLSGSITFRSRKNTANGNALITITTGQTGLFEDSSNSDSLSSGDLLCYSLVAAAGTGSATWKQVAFIYEASSGTAQYYIGGWEMSAAASGDVTKYMAIAGNNSSEQTAEGNCQSYIDAAGTFSRLRIYVSTNSSDVDIPFLFRNNAADTSLGPTIGAGTTGVYEDTTNSASVSAGDKVAFGFFCGGTVGTLGVRYTQLRFVPTATAVPMIQSEPGGLTLTTSSFYTMISRVATGVTTASDVAMNIPFDATISNFRANITSLNFSTNHGYWGIYDGADTNLKIDITTSSGGWFSDVDSDTIVAGSDVCIRYTATASGNATYRNSSFLIDFQTNTTVDKPLTSLARIQVTKNPTIPSVSRIQKTISNTNKSVARIRVSVNKSISSLARITNSTSKLLLALSRIQNKSDKGISSLSRIQNTLNKQSTSLGRIQNTVSQQFSAKASIASGGATLSKLLNAIARIQVASDEAISAIARIQATNRKTISSVSRIQATLNKNLTALARIQKTLDKNIASLARIQNTTSQNIAAVSRIRATTSYGITAKASIITTGTVNKLLTALSRIQNTTSTTLRSIGRVQVSVNKGITSISRIQQNTSFAIGAISRITAITNKSYTSLSNIRNTTTRIIGSKASIITQGTTLKTLTALANIRGTTTRQMLALARIQKSNSSVFSSLARIGLRNDKAISSIARIRNTSSTTFTSTSRIQKYAQSSISYLAKIQNTVSVSIKSLARIRTGKSIDIKSIASIRNSTSRFLSAFARIVPVGFSPDLPILWTNLNFAYQDFALLLGVKDFSANFASKDESAMFGDKLQSVNFKNGDVSVKFGA